MYRLFAWSSEVQFIYWLVLDETREILKFIKYLLFYKFCVHVRLYVLERSDVI